MRKNLMLLFIVFIVFKLPAMAIEDSTAAKLFDKTLLLISKYSDLRGEFPGPVTDTIASNVYKIIYQYNDSLVAIEKKLDLFHFMLFNQRFATNYYRSIIFHKILAYDSLVLTRGEFIAPLLFCHYCGDTKVLEVIKNSNCLELKLDQLPEEYKMYFQHLLRTLKSIDCAQNPSPELKTTLKYMHYANILNKKLLIKYPLLSR